MELIKITAAALRHIVEKLVLAAPAINIMEQKTWIVFTLLNVLRRNSIWAFFPPAHVFCFHDHFFISMRLRKENGTFEKILCQLVFAPKVSKNGLLMQVLCRTIFTFTRSAIVKEIWRQSKVLKESKNSACNFSVIKHLKWTYWTVAAKSTVRRLLFSLSKWDIKIRNPAY